MLLESACAVALSTGSAICLWRLLFLPAENDGRSNNNDHERNQSHELLLALFFVSCSAGIVAVWSVKGPHACWHPRSGPSLWDPAGKDYFSLSTGDGRKKLAEVNDNDDEMSDEIPDTPCPSSGDETPGGERLERQSSLIFGPPGANHESRHMRGKWGRILQIWLCCSDPLRVLRVYALGGAVLKNKSIIHTDRRRRAT